MPAIKQYRASVPGPIVRQRQRAAARERQRKVRKAAAAIEPWRGCLCHRGAYACDFFVLFLAAGAFTAFLPCGRELPYEPLNVLPRAVRLSPLPMELLQN